jgi:2-polyprenyl-3-methyl-5-hydroxy-6-metoxy-1,4-benzoquinol methylase
MSDLPQQGLYRASERLEVAPYIPTGATSALDVGCGSGGFGRTLRRALGPSARIVGVDPVESNVASSAEGNGFDEVLHGYFPDAFEGRGDTFDLIVFNDVLEHVVDPWALLREVPKQLAPGGKVLAAIPNIAFLPVILQMLKGRWDYTDEGTLDRTHVRFFTLATAREMFEQEGYEVEVCVGANSLADSRRVLRPFKPLLRGLQFLHVVIVATPRNRSGSAPAI